MFWWIVIYCHNYKLNYKTAKHSLEDTAFGVPRINYGNLASVAKYAVYGQREIRSVVHGRGKIPYVCSLK